LGGREDFRNSKKQCGEHFRTNDILILAFFVGRSFPF